MVRNWKEKLGALLVAIVLWYVIKGYLRRRGSIPQGIVPGQLEAFRALPEDAPWRPVLPTPPTEV